MNPLPTLVSLKAGIFGEVFNMIIIYPLYMILGSNANWRRICDQFGKNHNEMQILDEGTRPSA